MKDFLHFRERFFIIIIILIKIPLKFILKGLIDKYHRIGLDNGLMPNRRQVIV